MKARWLTFVIVIVIGFVSLAWVTVTKAQGPIPRAPRSAMGTAFTYQGQLKSGGSPYSGSCSLQFDLWDDASTGTRIAGPVNGNPSPVSVTNGLFTVKIDFGPGVFDGGARFLQIGAKCGSEVSYTPLTPRQELSPAPYALDADTLDGQHASAFTYTAGKGLELAGNQFKVKGSGYQNMLVVAKSGGDFTSIAAALYSITDAGPANHYLVYVAPGIYTETVSMKPYVDIEGAGELATTIASTGNTVCGGGTVRGATDAELRSLTVWNSGSGCAIGIYNATPSVVNDAARFTHVTVAVWGGTDETFGFYNSNYSWSKLTNVTVTTSGGSSVSSGVYNVNASSTIQDSSISASNAAINYGILNATLTTPTSPLTVTVLSSQIHASDHTIFTSADFTTHVGGSELAGGVASGPAMCAGVWKENFAFYAGPSCP